MKRLHQVVLAITLLVVQVFPSPSAVTCLLRIAPGWGLAEHACCRHMPPTCGAENKPSSVGCCAQKTEESNLQATAPKPFSFDDDVAALLGPTVPFTAELKPNLAGGITDWTQVHPPGPDLSRITPLRI